MTLLPDDEETPVADTSDTGPQADATLAVPQQPKKAEETRPAKTADASGRTGLEKQPRAADAGPAAGLSSRQGNAPRTTATFRKAALASFALRILEEWADVGLTWP